MEESSDNDLLMKEYLLGGLSRAELDRVEESLMLDDAFYEELAAYEDELIDQYIDNDLSVEDHDRFERYFLVTPARHEEVRFARALKRYLSGQSVSRKVPVDSVQAAHRSQALIPAKANMGRRAAVAAVLLTAIAAGLLLVAKNWRDNAQSTHHLIEATLTPGATRAVGDQIARVSIPPGTDEVQLHLLLQGHYYQIYQAVLKDDKDKPVFTGRHLKINSDQTPSNVVVDIPVRYIPSGDYKITLGGVDADGSASDVDTYRFRVPIDDGAGGNP